MDETEANKIWESLNRTKKALRREGVELGKKYDSLDGEMIDRRREFNKAGLIEISHKWVKRNPSILDEEDQPDDMDSRV